MNTFNLMLRQFPLAACAAATLVAGNFISPVAAAEQEFAGERIVHLLQEPRHRTVHQDGDIYVLDVQVNPGDESLAHVHDSALLVTMISTGAGPANGRVTTNTDYVTTNVTHKISNAGPGLMRIIAMTNLSPRQDPLSSDQPQGMPADPTIENAWFRSYRIILDPGAESAPLLLENPSVAGTSISVETLNGTVMLSGFAKSSAERSTAETIARDVNGVKQVKNEIAVRP